jgi:hypothetical protein
MGLLLLGWIVGEVKKLQPLRIVCLLILLPLIAIAPYGLGRFSGSTNAYIEASGATDRFVDAAVEQLDAQREDRVHEELRTLAGKINQTYEGGSFVEEVDDATARLTSP